MELVDERGNPCPTGQRGYLVAHPPLPPGALQTLWKDDQRFVDNYWKAFEPYGKRVFFSGDYAIKDTDGYYWLLGRADAVINVAGHRMGTREVEEVISSHSTVAEASAIGVTDEVKGQAIAAFVVLKKGIDESEELLQDIMELIRNSRCSESYRGFPRPVQERLCGGSCRRCVRARQWATCPRSKTTQL
ncbi:MAG: AMP-binding protein [Candidatus Bipolaricaulota bacterium]